MNPDGFHEISLDLARHVSGGNAPLWKVLPRVWRLSPIARKGESRAPGPALREAGLRCGEQSQRRKSGRRPAGGAGLAANPVTVEHGISNSPSAGSLFEGGEAALKPPPNFSIGLASWPACVDAFIT
ncbi:MAG: hypothetical protein ABSF67_18815 [Roseiarcus sp.]